MTTEITLCVSGNKAIHVTSGTTHKIMLPGSHDKFLIHGDIGLSVLETGDFISDEKMPKLIETFYQGQ